MKESQLSTSPRSSHIDHLRAPVVYPLGNSAYLSNACNPSRRSSLGLFAQLSDPLILNILDAILAHTDPLNAATALAALCATSIYAFAFASDDDLWRRICFAAFSPVQIATVSFRSSWRHSFLRLISRNRYVFQSGGDVWPNAVVYSDLLFHKRRCLNYAIPSSLVSHADIPKISCHRLTLAEFRRRFERPNTPLVITHLVQTWPAFKSWSIPQLSNSHPHIPFHAGGFSFPLSSYFSYCTSIDNHDDQPLYIFDHQFAAKAPQLSAEYSVPPYFSDDLFSVLGDNRPHYRWLIIGPTRSGSSFHKDPNCTSAWNAVIRGRKKWVMYPPHVTPPGIYPTPDESHVTAPVSVSEWFMNFYDRDHLRANGGLECVVEEGQLVFVPMGWWHCVINLEFSIAITQNYVGRCNLRHVLKWVGERREQISGCSSDEQKQFISQKFEHLVKQEMPRLYEEEITRKCSAANSLNANGKRKQSLWDSLTSKPAKKHTLRNGDASQGKAESDLEATSTSFSFGF